MKPDYLRAAVMCQPVLNIAVGEYCLAPRTEMIEVVYFVQIDINDEAVPEQAA